MIESLHSQRGFITLFFIFINKFGRNLTQEHFLQFLAGIGKKVAFLELFC